ncbi:MULTISPECIES: hypothetical protein [unclassified Pseudoalteromonas]|uniref:hypothetical protein n=1 Tax=unclassified Pseudoalteromonas TaxID=194690 RepID=UPI0023596BB1|nr:MULTISPECIES: hypothetical protein [unclassified Pseudoalteromonas]MDC9566140.1 hypothetical protein [Pseudoalteromonas sp. GAB2316C]MDC9570490.1 hypothetical protein [Pseudoalteromonas sp. GABNB9D]MDC9573741.1 hypothetical protein [Pseudoalteromonas sp. GABNS16A]MDC9578960.1 hypothetical protein [Pseudoalteromonas sp. GABNS16E]MDC9586567.1 hypothetical protein [Pseudoalteromonas sp. GABNS16C]
MSYRFIKAALLQGAIIFLVAACSQGAINKASSSHSSEWLLTDALYYNNKPVNWQQRRVNGCSTCLIQNDSVLQPEGITRFNTLYKDGEWVAVQEQSSLNVIRLKLPLHTPYLYVEQLANGELKLFNQQHTYKTKIGEVINITFKKQLFSVVITAFTLQDEKNVALPRRARLNYTAVKLI